MRPEATQVDVVPQAGRPPQAPSGDQRLFVDVLEEALGVLLACVLPPLKRAHRHFVRSPEVLRDMLHELILTRRDGQSVRRWRERSGAASCAQEDPDYGKGLRYDSARISR